MLAARRSRRTKPSRLPPRGSRAPKRSTSAPQRGQRGEQGVLRGCVQRVAAERGKIGDENHRADGAGEILGDDGEGQHAAYSPHYRLPRKSEDRHCLQDAADPQTGGQRQRARDETAGKSAQQSPRQNRHLSRWWHSSLRVKPSLEHERRGHRARSASANLNSITKASITKAAMSREEIREKRRSRYRSTRHERLAPRANARLGRHRFSRLAGQQRCDDTRSPPGRHRDIAPAPGGWFVESGMPRGAHQEQRAGARNQHADTIGGDVRRHAGGLFVFRKAFDAEGVDHDVLRRRSGRDQQCPNATRAGEDAGSRTQEDTIAPISRIWVNTSQPRRRPSRRDSRGTSSASTSGRPQRIRPCRAYRRARTGRWCEISTPDSRHPHQQRCAGQRQRQPGRKPEQHDDQHARLEIDRHAVEP